MFDFINISFIDILDIILVAGLIYWLIKLVRNTSATRIFIGILGIYMFWILARALDMKLLSFILGQLLGVGVIALIIIFQPEIRRFLLRFGSKGKSAFSSAIIKKIVKGSKGYGVPDEVLEEITSACTRMAETKTGALIVLKKDDSLEDYIQTGDTINALINSRLIENIFFKNTPLHDGAMIMSRHLIISARCTLPITARQDVPPRYGMRHRAAIGITEVSDAAALVVSEETGEISFVRDGKMQTIESRNLLRLEIERFYS